jgi:hypothetical protein
VDGIAASVLIAGDDPDAKDIVFAVARDMGFHPVNAGPLKATRDLEKLVGVMLFPEARSVPGPVEAPDRSTRSAIAACGIWGLAAAHEAFARGRGAFPKISLCGCPDGGRSVRP